MGVINYVCLIGDYVIVMYVFFDENLGKEYKMVNEFKVEFLDVCFVDIYLFYCLIVMLMLWFVDVIVKWVVDKNYLIIVLVLQFVLKYLW